jgi:hypothetical protein
MIKTIRKELWLEHEENDMISENSEKLISLKQASRLVPTFDGNTVHAGSVWRWSRKGIHGVRLEYVRCGRRIATSEAAMRRFFDALAKLDEENFNLPSASNRRKLNKSASDASVKLDQAGL